MSVPDWSDPERRASAGRSLKRDLDTIAVHARQRRSRLPAGREPRRGARAVDDGADRGPAHRRRRRPRPVAALPRRRSPVVPGTTGEERDPYAWLRRFGSRLAEVQLQQSDGLADHHWAFTAEHNATGTHRARRGCSTTLAASGAGDRRPHLRDHPGMGGYDDRVVDDLRTSVELWRGAIHDPRPAG